jgi:hypothetical protein
LSCNAFQNIGLDLSSITFWGKSVLMPLFPFDGRDFDFLLHGGQSSRFVRPVSGDAVGLSRGEG